MTNERIISHKRDAGILYAKVAFQHGERAYKAVVALAPECSPHVKAIKSAPKKGPGRDLRIYGRGVTRLAYTLQQNVAGWLDAQKRIARAVAEFGAFLLAQTVPDLRSRAIYEHCVREKQKALRDQQNEDFRIAWEDSHGAVRDEIAYLLTTHNPLDAIVEFVRGESLRLADNDRHAQATEMRDAVHQAFGYLEEADDTEAALRDALQSSLMVLARSIQAYTRTVPDRYHEPDYDALAHQVEAAFHTLRLRTKREAKQEADSHAH